MNEETNKDRTIKMSQKSYAMSPFTEIGGGGGINFEIGGLQTLYEYLVGRLKDRRISRRVNRVLQYVLDNKLNPSDERLKKAGLDDKEIDEYHRILSTTKYKRACYLLNCSARICHLMQNWISNVH